MDCTALSVHIFHTQGKLFGGIRLISECCCQIIVRHISTDRSRRCIESCGFFQSAMAGGIVKAAHFIIFNQYGRNLIPRYVSLIGCRNCRIRRHSVRPASVIEKFIDLAVSYISPCAWIRSVCIGISVWIQIPVMHDSKCKLAGCISLPAGLIRCR